jgi:hypothetical protein
MASLFFLPFPAQLDFWNCGSGRGEEPGGERGFPPDSDPFSNAESEENHACSSRAKHQKGSHGKTDSLKMLTDH